MKTMNPVQINSEQAPFASRPIFSDLYPLDEFYTARGLTLPSIARIEAGEVPEPYHSLLAHRVDMTSTLEKFHRDKIHIDVLARHTHENEYFREVVLVLDGTGKVVEFGALKVVLDCLPDAAQKEILKERHPLGRVLTDHGVVFSSRPRAYLRIASDEFIEEVLNLSGAQFLYGRRNTLVDAWDRPLAEIVEILPP